MAFQILDKNNNALTMGELDKEAAAFWGVELDSKHNVSPKGREWPADWYNFIGLTISQMLNSKYQWFEVIGALCGTAAIGENTFDRILSSIEYYKPYIELCLHWQSKGYTPVSC